MLPEYFSREYYFLLYSDEEYCATHSKKELIDTAKMITAASAELNKYARDIASKCPDKRMKHVSLDGTTYSRCGR